MKEKRRVLMYALGLLVLLFATVGDLSATEPQPVGSNPRTDFAACVDDQFKIDLLQTLDSVPVDTPEAQVEQLRDWVWSTLLARLASKRSEPELVAGIGRQPLFRDEGLSHVLEMPVGRSRSAIGKDGTVYVLEDRSSPEQVYEDVLEAIDRESLRLGEIPKGVQVYGVKFRMETAEAEVCRLGSVNQAWLQSARQGFRRARISKVEELEAFLAGGIDLLSASCTAGSGLEVTGRVRGRTSRAPITLEHIAALTQTPGRGLKYVPIKDLPIRQEAIGEARKRARVVAPLLDQIPTGGELPDEIESNPSVRGFLETIRTWKREHPQVLTEDLLLSYEVQIAVAEHLGFSLDPRANLTEALRKLEFLTTDQAGLIFGIPEETRRSLKALHDKAQSAGQPQGERLLLQATVSRVDTQVGGMVQEVLHATGYQCARYDGPLKGTEAGMTLFYTDLLAKLWAFDWHRSAPTGAIPGFISIPERQISGAYCGEDDGVRNTRIWFGPRQEGFARSAVSALQFAPVATRIFAAGSALGSDYSKEVEPSADSLQFIRWWDQHAGEIADWEPQYELLNQLVKWTLVRRIAEASDNSACLSFLGNVNSNRDQRFDHWLEKQKDLRWKGPLELLSKPKETTECLQLFESEGYSTCGEGYILSGGVDLPGPGDFAKRPIRKQSDYPYLRHLAPEQRARKSSDGAWQYSPIINSKGELSQVEVRISADAAQFSGNIRSARGVKIRSTDGFRLNEGAVSYREYFQLRDGGRKAEYRQTQEGRGVGRLTALDIQSGSVQIDVRTEEMQKAKQLAFEISERMGSQGSDLEKATKRVVAGDLPVLALDDGRVAIRLVPPEDQDGVYAIMSSGGGVRGPPPPLGPRFAIGALDPGQEGPDGLPGRIDVELLRESEAQPYFRRNNPRPTTDSDSTVETLREHLRQGDLTGARSAVKAPDTSPRALAEYIVGAAEKRQAEGIEGILDRLLLQPDATPELRRVERALARAYIELARQPPSPELQKFKVLQMKLAIYGRRLTAEDAYRQMTRQGDPAFAYVRRDVPQDIVRAERLPPVGYPPGVPLPPSQRYETWLIDQSTGLSEAPRQLTVGGHDFDLVKRPVLPRESWVWPYTSGSPYRLVSMIRDDDKVWPLWVVSPCQDSEDDQTVSDSGLPDCRLPEGAVAEEMLAQEQRQAMSKVLSSLLEKIKACDLNGNGALEGADEEKCLEKLRQELSKRRTTPPE